MQVSWAVKIFRTSLWCGSECLGISSELKNHLPVSVVCRLLSGHHYEVTESSWEDSYPVHTGRTLLKSRQRRSVSSLRPQQSATAQHELLCPLSKVVGKEPEVCLQKGAETDDMVS